MDQLRRETQPPSGTLPSPVPQYWNPATGKYERVEGSGGATKVTLTGTTDVNVKNTVTARSLPNVASLFRVETSSTSLDAGSRETVRMYAPEGKIYRIYGAGMRAPAVPGGSGKHWARVFIGLDSWNANEILIAEGDYNSNFAFGPYKTTDGIEYFNAPPGKHPPLFDVVVDSSMPITFNYQSGGGAPQAGERWFIVIGEEVEVGA